MAKDDDSKREVTYADLEDIPPLQVGEILGDELVVSPRPAAPHARAALRLGMRLAPLESEQGVPGGWLFLMEPELHLGGEALVPDLAGWRRERMPVMPHVPAFEVAPDWVCEVVSPSTAAIDRGRKMASYAREQVGYLWLLTPLEQTLEVFRRDGERWRLVDARTGSATIRVEPFETLELPLGALWAR
jgi:Uma2 family endonuclease